MVLAAVAVAVLVVVESGHPAVAAGALVAAVLGWAILLRPRVSVIHNDLVLRNPFVTYAVPLAAIEEVVVRQILVLRVGDRRLTSTALGRTRRSLLTQRRSADPDVPVSKKSASYGEFADERIHDLMERARLVAGVRPASDEQLALADGVRTTYAWPEVIAIALSLVGCVVLAVAV